MARVFIGLGTNEGNRDENVRLAMDLIREIPETQLEKQSEFKEYAAAEASEGQPPFLNGVICVETELLPVEFLHKLQVIERKMGRSAKGDGSSRTIDLDILSYGDAIVIEGKNLIVPHARLHLRMFVLEPLAQIEPEWKHPKLGKTAQELLTELGTPHEDHENRSGAEDSSTTVSP